MLRHAEKFRDCIVSMVGVIVPERANDALRVRDCVRCMSLDLDIPVRAVLPERTRVGACFAVRVITRELIFG